MKSNETRQKILETSSRIFYLNGFKATGLEVVAKHVGLTKPSLYYHFGSKEELVEETLRYLTENARPLYQSAWDSVSDNKDKLLILFDKMHDYFRQSGFNGCPFINAATEYTNHDSVAWKTCESHYAFVTDNLEVFARNAGLREPRLLAERITTLIIGAYSGWVVSGNTQAAMTARETARLVIQAHQ